MPKWPFGRGENAFVRKKHKVPESRRFPPFNIIQENPPGFPGLEKGIFGKNVLRARRQCFNIAGCPFSGYAPCGGMLSIPPQGLPCGSPSGGLVVADMAVAMSVGMAMEMAMWPLAMALALAKAWPWSALALAMAVAMGAPPSPAVALAMAWSCLRA